MDSIHRYAPLQQLLLLRSHGVVDVLDLANRIARANGKGSASVEDVLAAYAGREDGLMAK